MEQVKMGKDVTRNQLLEDGEMELLDRKCTRGNQSLELVSLWAHGTHKLRVRRKRDSYAFQSGALVERWDGTEWREVATLAFGAMNGVTSTMEFEASRKPRPTPSELADEKELLRLAEMVLA